MLNNEQKNIIMESLWIVNDVLKAKNLQRNNDLRQEAILYLCKCIQRFDPSRGVKWTTYAYRNVFLYVCRTYASWCKKNSREIPLEAATLSVSHENNVNDKILVQTIKYRCTQLERRVMELKECGYNSNEIQKRCGLTNYSYRKAMKNIQNIARTILFDAQEKDPTT